MKHVLGVKDVQEKTSTTKKHGTVTRYTLILDSGDGAVKLRLTDLVPFEGFNPDDQIVVEITNLGKADNPPEAESDGS